MARPAHIILGLAIVGIASCQLVSGVGDYTFEPSGSSGAGAGSSGGGGMTTVGPGGGGGQPATIPWAYQLQTDAQVLPTALLPGRNDNSAIFLGFFEDTLQFNRTVGGTLTLSTTAAGDNEDGFLFEASGADAPPAPFEIEGGMGAQVRPQAVVARPDSYIIAGTVVGGLAGTSNLPDTGALFVGEWGVDGQNQWFTGWSYGAQASVEVLDLSDDGQTLLIAGTHDGLLGLLDPVGHGIPEGIDGYAALLSVDALEQEMPMSAVQWSRAFRGGNAQTIRGHSRRSNGWVLYGNYQGSLVYHDGDNAPVALDNQGGDGSLFVVSLDGAGSNDPNFNRFIRMASGAAEAVSIESGPAGRLLLGGHFAGEIQTVAGNLQSQGLQDMFLVEMNDSLSVTTARSWGASNGFQKLAGAGYLDPQGGLSVAVFATACVGSLNFANEPPPGEKADVCLGFLLETAAGSHEYEELGVVRLGDEGASEGADQAPVSLVTRGTEIIVSGLFRGNLIDPTIFQNTKPDIDDGFVFAIEAN